MGLYGLQVCTIPSPQLILDRWEDIGFYGSLDGILQKKKIGGNKFKYEYVHPMFMPIPPQEREYETHEQLLWKQRGYTLSEVSYNGVYNHKWPRRTLDAGKNKDDEDCNTSSSSTVDVGEDNVIEMKDLAKK